MTERRSKGKQPTTGRQNKERIGRRKGESETEGEKIRGGVGGVQTQVSGSKSLCIMKSDQIWVATCTMQKKRVAEKKRQRHREKEKDADVMDGLVSRF